MALQSCGLPLGPTSNTHRHSIHSAASQSAVEQTWSSNTSAPVSVFDNVLKCFVSRDASEIWLLPAFASQAVDPLDRKAPRQNRHGMTQNGKTPAFLIHGPAATSMLARQTMLNGEDAAIGTRLPQGVAQAKRHSDKQLRHHFVFSLSSKQPCWPRGLRTQPCDSGAP